MSKVLTSAPPPPPAEIKIRTMRSDIESMMRSGGGAPSFENVAVPGLSLEKEGYKTPVVERTPMPAPASFSIPAAQEFISEPTSGSHLVPILIVTLVAILAIGVVGYFAYVLFK